jgi:hypothetical protein
LDGKLDLVGDGLDLGKLQELSSSSDVEVGDTNVLDESLVDKLGVSLTPIKGFLPAYLLHLGPGGGDIIRELDIEELLSRLAFDGVLLGRKDTLGSVNLQVDLACQLRLWKDSTLQLTFQCMRYKSRYSRPKFFKVSLTANSTCSGWWWSSKSLEVIQSSSRGTPEALIP